MRATISFSFVILPVNVGELSLQCCCKETMGQITVINGWFNHTLCLLPAGKGNLHSHFECSHVKNGKSKVKILKNPDSWYFLAVLLFISSISMSPDESLVLIIVRRIIRCFRIHDLFWALFRYKLELAKTFEFHCMLLNFLTRGLRSWAVFKLKPTVVTCIMLQHCWTWPHTFPPCHLFTLCHCCSKAKTTFCCQVDKSGYFNSCFFQSRKARSLLLLTLCCHPGATSSGIRAVSPACLLSRPI